MRLRTFPRAIIAAPSLISVLGRNGKVDVGDEHSTAAALYGDVVGPTCNKRSAHPPAVGKRRSATAARKVGLIAGDAQQSRWPAHASGPIAARVMTGTGGPQCALAAAACSEMPPPHRMGL
jgi:hypothetical protein